MVFDHQRVGHIGFRQGGGGFPALGGGIAVERDV
jgi:hypothetical protein